MNIITKPMLAGKCESIHNLKYPVLATPKLDGIRCLIRDGIAVSRNFKPIPNKFIQATLTACGRDGLDGELMIKGSNNFQEVSSAVMSQDGKPDFEYRVFDYVGRDLIVPYINRMNDLAAVVRAIGNPRVVAVLPKMIEDTTGLEVYAAKCLDEGYEGVMVRTPESPYKCGRSSEREGYLLKVKRFEDKEALVIGFKERLHNTNEAAKDELGRTKRSSHQANMVPMGTLGALCCRTLDTKVEFDIGTGLDDALRLQLWRVRNTLAGRLVKFKSQPTGVKDKPRFPVFLGFRSEDDL
jgi:DNA ligase-1